MGPNEHSWSPVGVAMIMIDKKIFSVGISQRVKTHWDILFEMDEKKVKRG